MSDEDLARRFFAGDERATRTLVERHHRRLYGMLVRLTRSPAEAEELFQETFLRAFNASARFDRSRRFKPWLFAIAVNLVRDRWKRRAHPASPELRDASELPEPGSTPEDGWIRRADLASALLRIPASHRDVLVLRYFQGLTEGEIAATVGIPRGTVKSRVHHGLRKLRDLLQGETT